MEFPANIQKYVLNAARQFGTPTYLYLPHIIEERLEQLMNACPGFEPRYAVKTNPNPWLLKWFRGRIKTLDVSSSGEIHIARNCGWPGEALEFTGPAKTRRDIEFALKERIGSIVIEDLSEAQLIQEVAAELKVKVRVLVRIAPSCSEEKFGVRLAGRATQFGVDEELLATFIDECKKMECLNLVGFHIYSGSQCLDDKALADHFEYLWALFEKACGLLEQPAEELVFGAGMGIPYHDNDPSLQLNELKQSCQNIRQSLDQKNPKVAAFIELGRFLVGEAGFFLTQVIRVKTSKGRKIAICDGGMNHNLAACGHMGGIGHRHYSMINASAEADAELETYKIVGPLCTAIDTLAQRIELPELKPGQIIAVGCAGGYGPSSSPLFFISHSAPKEVVLTRNENDGESLQECTWLPTHTF